MFRLGTSAAGHDVLLREIDIQIVEARAQIEREPVECPLVLRKHAEFRAQIVRETVGRRHFGDQVRDAVVEAVSVLESMFV